MFSNKDKASSTNYDTLISSKTEIIGDVKFTGGLHVDGIIKGNLIAEAGTGAVVRISDKGQVEGEIHAPNIIVNGKVVGDVHSSEYIELAKKAEVTGDVYYQMMEMVMGAQVNGKLNHQAQGKGKKAAAKADAEAASSKAAVSQAKVD